jgi:transcriptional regulator with XRE-family HTH domain
MDETIGQRIRRKRGEAGYTQVALASKAEIGHSTLRCWEGDVWHPQAVPLARLAAVLKTTVKYLEDGDDKD